MKFSLLFLAIVLNKISPLFLCREGGPDHYIYNNNGKQQHCEMNTQRINILAQSRQEQAALFFHI